MFRLSAFLLLVSIVATGRAQEVRLDSCRQLPIVKVSVNQRQYQFLLDTGAATTLLNVKSFSSADSADITMESWNGTVSTSAREVVLHDLSIGEHQLANLRLLAVDLTPLERSCQRRVDGVLGADLIAKLGLTIDLKNHVATLDGNARTPEARFSELDEQYAACEQAFNRSDEKALESCLDPDIVLLTSKGDFRGRKAVMRHFKDAYFGQNPPVQIAMTPRGRHALGNVLWIEYDMAVTVGDQIMKTRATALYQKAGERWLMANMNYAVAEHGK